MVKVGYRVVDQHPDQSGKLVSAVSLACEDKDELHKFVVYLESKGWQTWIEGTLEGQGFGAHLYKERNGLCELLSLGQEPEIVTKR